MPEKNTSSPVIGPKNGSTGGAVKLDRSKLHSSTNSKVTTNGSDSGSARTVLTLVMVIILLAVGGAFAVRYMQNQSGQDTNNDATLTSTPTEEPLITEEPDPLDNGFNGMPMEATSANPATDETKYTNSDSEIEATETETVFGITQVSGQSYTDFYRLTFNLTGETEAEDAMPAIEANYRSAVPEIEVMLMSSDSTELLESSWEIENSVVTMLEKNMTADTTQEAQAGSSFVISLSEGTTYYMFVNGSDLIIDIMETENTKPVAEEPEPTTTPSDTQEETPSESTSGNVIQGNTTANDAKIAGFTFGDSAEKFTYQLKLDGDKIPNVNVTTANQDGKFVVEVEITNLGYDALPKDGVGYRDFTEMGVRDVEELSITNANFVSNYKFTVAKQVEYSVSLENVEGQNQIFIEFMH